MTAGRTLWSCLLDDTPAIWRDFPVWLATITGPGGVRHDDLVVHHACDLPPALDRMLEGLGVRRCRTEPFDQRTPPANKIAQCSTDYGTAEHVVLTDVDLLFGSPLPIDEIRGDLAGKLVDSANPAISRLREFFADAALAIPDPIASTQHLMTGAHPFETLPVNLNGGLYIVDRELLAPLGRTWASHARRMLERDDLQPAEVFHCDQIAMAMALTELDLDVEVLPETWNFPGHLGRSLAPPLPMVIHHHGRLDENLRELDSTAPARADAIRRAVADIEAQMRSSPTQ